VRRGAGPVTTSVLLLSVLVVAGCATGVPTPSQAPPAGPSTVVLGAASASPSPTASPSPAASPSPTASPSPAPVFASTVGPITPALAERMASSWREGCPVALEDLRYLTVTHRTFDGRVATGELVVHADVADDVVAVLAELFAAGYPIRSLRLVDDFDGSDDASMAADNTSAFNCRPISRGTGWSEHAYGRAIDVNPRENPYVRGDLVLPPEGEPYADRPDEPGVIHADDAVVRAFAVVGWRWGGYWDEPVDYQHFSLSGR